MQKRIVVWWLLVLQMICFSFVETNLNIAIVSMVAVGCAPNTTIKNDVVCPTTSLFQEDRSTKSSCTTRSGFAWTKAEQNMVLSGSFWLQYISILLGGVLAEKFGPKRVVGISQLLASTASSLIPLFAYRGPVTVACIRAVQEFLLKLMFPAALSKMMGSWCPPQERGRFHMTFYVGSYIGNFISDSCFGYISEYIHWEYVFHVTSIYGIIVNVLWFALAYDSPHHHPTISSEEKSRIKYNPDNSIIDETIPWRSIFTSLPFIVCLAGFMPGVWLYRMPITYLPEYFKTTFGLNAYQIGILTGTWQLMAAFFVLIIGYSLDKSIEKNILSITNTRKLSSLIAYIFGSLALIIAACVGCDLKAAIVCLTLYTIFETCSSFGPSLTVFDLSPRYCGILAGIAGTLISLGNFLLSLLINYFTDIWNTDELWKKTFLYSSLYAMIGNIIFIIFGTSEPQSWNNHKADQSMNDIYEKEPTEVDLLLNSRINTPSIIAFGGELIS